MTPHSPPLCRALTLVEALLTLVLLGSVLAAGNAWVQMTSQASKDNVYTVNLLLSALYVNSE